MNSVTSLSVSSISISSTTGESIISSVDMNKIGEVNEDLSAKMKVTKTEPSPRVLVSFEKLLLIMSMIHCLVLIKVYTGY